MTKFKASSPSDRENMVLMLDLKALVQQSAVLPDLVVRNQILIIAIACLSILQRHVSIHIISSVGATDDS